MSVAFFILGVCIVLGLPAGAILLALGLFERGRRSVCACGYSHQGLKTGDPCPECGRPIATPADIPRVKWQIATGAALLILAGLSVLTFVAFLCLMVRQ